jgi:hypothetical protein
MLQGTDWAMISLAFFLVHWVMQTPEAILKKATSVGALSFHFVLTVFAYFLALCSAVGPFAMFLAVLIATGNAILGFSVWRLYLFLVWSNNWHELGVDEALDSTEKRHLVEYPYQLAHGVETLLSFAWLMTIVIKTLVF